MSDISPVAKEQLAAPAAAATESHNVSDKNPRSTEKLRHCLSLLIDKGIPQAEQVIERRRRATEGVSTKSLMHRVYYDTAVSAQHEVDWLNDARRFIERSLKGEEYQMLRLKHLESVLLRMRRDDEAEERFAAEREDEMEEYFVCVTMTWREQKKEVGSIGVATS